jgi:hypothetical protein
VLCGVREGALDMTQLLSRAAAGKVAALSPEPPAWLATKST